MVNRLNEIENNTPRNSILNYGNIKLGFQTIDDATLQLGTYGRVNPRLGKKSEVLRAINNYDVKTMREISDFFYKTSGIYARVLRYMAFMYCYDWFVTPYVADETAANKAKLLKSFNDCLKFLDDFQVKK